MQKKEKEIVNKAQELFFTYGFKSITMDDIASSLGASKKTLYCYFNNKADLVDRVIQNFIQGQKENFCSHPDPETNAIDQLHSIYSKTCSHLKEVNRSAAFDLQKFFPGSYKVFEKYKKEFVFNQVLQNLKHGISQGLYRKDINKEIIATFYVERLEIIMNPDIFSLMEYSFNEILREIFIYHIRGIASNKGIEYLENHVKF